MPTPSTGNFLKLTSRAIIIVHCYFQFHMEKSLGNCFKLTWLTKIFKYLMISLNYIAKWDFAKCNFGSIQRTIVFGLQTNQLMIWNFFKKCGQIGLTVWSINCVINRLSIPLVGLSNEGKCRKHSRYSESSEMDENPSIE